MAKVTTFIIGMLLMMLFFGVFGVLISDARTTFNENLHSDYDLTAFDKVNNITETLEETRNKTNELSAGDASVTDIIGGYFSSAYSALKITGQSVDVFKTVAEESIDQLPLSDNADGSSGMKTLFKTIITAIALVSIIIGVLIAAAVKRDL
jgi:hypothetical protein